MRAISPPAPSGWHRARCWWMRSTKRFPSGRKTMCWRGPSRCEGNPMSFDDCQPAPDLACFGPPAPGIEPPERPVLVSLYERVTRRLRAARTLFGDNVKLILRQLDEEQFALLKPPYLL